MQGRLPVQVVAEVPVHRGRCHRPPGRLPAERLFPVGGCRHGLPVGLRRLG